MEAKIELITPQIAEQYLAKNSNNYRRLYKATVDQYASEMINGEWIFNGEAIKFNKSGKLVDGQHRLSAIVKSGCSVPMVVITDVNDDVNTFDIGKTRSVSDIASANGLDYFCTNTTTVGAVGFLLGCNGTYKTPKQTMVSFVTKESEIWSKSYQACTVGDSKARLARRAPCVLAAYSLLKRGSQFVYLCEFFRIVNTGFPNEEKESSPAIVLRNFLLKHQRAINSVREFRMLTFSATLSAYRDYMEGVARKQSYRLDDAHVALFNAMYSEATKEVKQND